MGLEAFLWAKHYKAALSPMARLCLLHIADNGYPEEHLVDTSFAACAASWQRPISEAVDALGELERAGAIKVADRDGDTWTVMLTMPGWEARWADHAEALKWIEYAGKPVVYRLFNDGDLVYIGSTGHIRTRLTNHRADGKVFDEWTAEVFASRDDAYTAEAELIAALSPLMNKRGVTR